MARDSSLLRQAPALCALLAVQVACCIGAAAAAAGTPAPDPSPAAGGVGLASPDPYPVRLRAPAPAAPTSPLPFRKAPATVRRLVVVSPRRPAPKTHRSADAGRATPTRRREPPVVPVRRLAVPALQELLVVRSAGTAGRVPRRLVLALGALVVLSGTFVVGAARELTR